MVILKNIVDVDSATAIAKWIASEVSIVLLLNPLQAGANTREIGV